MALGLTVNGPFLTLFHGEVLGHSRAYINSLFAYGNLVGALFVLFAGKLSDWVGAKRVLYLGIVFHTSFILIWSLSRISILFILAIPFVQWIYLAYQIVLVEITEERERGRKVGLFGTVTGGFGSLSPFLGGYIRRELGDLSPFVTALIFALLSLLPSKKVHS
jgi:MFS family permease